MTGSSFSVICKFCVQQIRQELTSHVFKTTRITFLFSEILRIQIAIIYSLYWRRKKTYIYINWLPRSGSQWYTFRRCFPVNIFLVLNVLFLISSFCFWTRRLNNWRQRGSTCVVCMYNWTNEVKLCRRRKFFARIFNTFYNKREANMKWTLNY